MNKNFEENNMNNTFNMEAALEAAKNAPVKSRSGAQSELTKNILAVLTAFGAPMSVAQITAALNAGGMSVNCKKVCDYAWPLCHKQGKLVSPERGIYQLATTDAK